MWIDRDTDMTKLIVAFCNLAKVPKNTSDIYDIKYVMTNMTIVYEQRLTNLFLSCTTHKTIKISF